MSIPKKNCRLNYIKNSQESSLFVAQYPSAQTQEWKINLKHNCISRHFVKYINKYSCNEKGDYLLTIVRLINSLCPNTQKPTSSSGTL